MLDCTGGSYGNNGCMGGLMDNCKFLLMKKKNFYFLKSNYTGFRYVITNGIKLMKYYPYTAKVTNF